LVPFGIASAPHRSRSQPATELETDYLGETAHRQARAAGIAAGTNQTRDNGCGNVVEAVTEEARKQGLTLEGAKIRSR